MTPRRRAYESGHKPKCLVVIDDSPECDRAIYYASRWALRSGGGVVMLRVIEPDEQNQEWRGVADIIRAEAQDEASQVLDRAAGRANGLAAITPERVILEGVASEMVLELIDKDLDIALMVLAASVGAEGPGPIVTATAKNAGTFPIPVAIVPGTLTDDDIDALS